ncbi:MAG TPA: bacillithiol biosynthesis BshC [Planctomycetota bacterium]|nr:bacillithiol biosynthesis BshC [Planctomycetota bacterium]
MRIEPVGYERLRGRYAALFVSHATGDGRAAPFFPAPWREGRALAERARRAADKGVEPSVVAALRRTHAAAGAPPAAMAAIDRLERGAAVVVTGQQPAVGGGPLYDLYKAAGALAAARAVEAAGAPCVAVFWNHSDDVRGGDAAAFPDRDNGLKEIPLPPGEPGTPLYEAGDPDGLRMFARALAEALPQTEFAEALAARILSDHRGSVAESFTRALLSILGSKGLVVLEPRDLEGERTARFFDEHLKRPERLSRAAEAGRRAVASAGFEDQLGKDVGLDVFEMRPGRRIRLERAERTSSHRLSAGVALRPLLQDAVLPTCAYVGGPGELGYLAALGPAYEAFGIERPAVLPRPTATLMEPKVSRAVEKLGAVEILFGDEAALAAAFGGPRDGGPERVERLAERWSAEVAESLGDAAASPSLARALEKTTGKIREAMKALAGRLRDELARQETTDQGRRARLLGHVFPGGKLQERVFTPLYYAALFGEAVLPSVADALAERAFAPAHHVLHLP